MMVHGGVPLIPALPLLPRSAPRPSTVLATLVRPALTYRVKSRHRVMVASIHQGKRCDPPRSACIFDWRFVAEDRVAAQPLKASLS